MSSQRDSPYKTAVTTLTGNGKSSSGTTTSTTTTNASTTNTSVSSSVTGGAGGGIRAIYSPQCSTSTTVRPAESIGLTLIGRQSSSTSQASATSLNSTTTTSNALSGTSPMSVIIDNPERVTTTTKSIAQRTAIPSLGVAGRSVSVASSSQHQVTCVASFGSSNGSLTVTEGSVPHMGERGSSPGRTKKSSVVGPPLLTTTSPSPLPPVGGTTESADVDAIDGDPSELDTVAGQQFLVGMKPARKTKLSNLRLVNGKPSYMSASFSTGEDPPHTEVYFTHPHGQFQSNTRHYSTSSGTGSLGAVRIASGPAGAHPITGTAASHAQKKKHSLGAIQIVVDSGQGSDSLRKGSQQRGSLSTVRQLLLEDQEPLVNDFLTESMNYKEQDGGYRSPPRYASMDGGPGTGTTMDDISLYGTPRDETGPAFGGEGDPKAGSFMRSQIEALFQPSDNKLAMKLFGSKKALMKERIRQKESGLLIIHPCSNFR